MEAKFKIGQKVFSLKHLNSYRIEEIAITRDGVRYCLAVAGGTKWADQADLAETVDDAVLQVKGQYDELKGKIETYLAELKVVAKTLEKACQMQKEDGK